MTPPPCSLHRLVRPFFVRILFFAFQMDLSREMLYIRICNVTSICEMLEVKAPCRDLFSFSSCRLFFFYILFILFNLLLGCLLTAEKEHSEECFQVIRVHLLLRISSSLIIMIFASKCIIGKLLEAFYSKVLFIEHRQTKVLFLLSFIIISCG